MLLTFLIAFIFCVTMLTAIYRDLTTMTIPNWASLFILIGFFVTVPFLWSAWAEVGPPWALFGQHLLVGGSVFLFGFIIHALRLIGGGDAKLMAATAFWWQWPDLTYYIVYTAIAGGALGVFMLLTRSQLKNIALFTPSWMGDASRFIPYGLKREKDMPYGLALAFGALMTLPQSEIFKLAAGLG